MEKLLYENANFKKNIKDGSEIATGVFSHDTVGSTTMTRATDQKGILITEEGRNLLTSLQRKFSEYLASKLRNGYLTACIRKLSWQRDDTSQSQSHVNEQNQSEIKKYNKKLMFYRELKQIIKEKRAELSQQVEEGNEEREDFNRLQFQETQALLNREIEIGKQCVDSKTGKSVHVKVIYPWVERHKGLLKLLSEARHKYIIANNYLQKRHDEINKINQFRSSSKFNIIDYENLLLKKTIYEEKIDERYYDLQKFKKKIFNVSNNIVNVTDALDIVQTDATDNYIKLLEMETTYKMECDVLNNLRIEREKLRHTSTRLKKKAGLLYHPKLLTDYEKCLKQIKDKSVNLANIMKTYEQENKVAAKLRYEVAKFVC